MCCAGFRRLPKKKDLFDPTDDKWVHDKFDLPPEQDLDYDTVRISNPHWVALYAAGIPVSPFLGVRAASSGWTSQTALVLCFMLQVTPWQMPSMCIKGGLHGLHRALLAVEGEGAGGAAARRAEDAAVAAAALLMRTAIRPLSPTTMWGPQVCQMVEPRMPVRSRVIGQPTRSSGRRLVRLREASSRRQLGAGTATTGCYLAPIP